MEKKTLAVIFGSRSCEREVAIISACQLMKSVDREKYDLVPIYISERGEWFTGDALTEVETFVSFDGNRNGIRRVWLDMTAGSGALLTMTPGKGLFGHPTEECVARLSAAIIVMHGMNGEDGTLQGMLELANIPYTSTGVAGSAIGMDKIMMKQFFRGGDLPVLPDCFFTRSDFAADAEKVCKTIEDKLGYPVFVKPANLGSSIGVSRADDREGLMDSLELAFEYDRRVLVEKGLDHPIELNCSVLGYDDDVTASPIEMPVSAVTEEFLDFRKKYLEGSGSKGMASLSRVVPAPIPEELTKKIQSLSCEIFRQMDCKGVVRIDYMYDKKSENIYITEINTIPGSLAFYLWAEAGVTYPELIDRMVKYALKAHEDRNERTWAFESDILKGFTGGGAKGAKGAKSGAKMGAKA